MKQDWEIKKLGEVCEVICGQDYKAVKDDNGKYPIYGTGGVMGYASQYRCPSNSVIIGRKGSINNPLFVETEFWNVDTAFGVVPNKEMLCPKFFFLFCKSFDFTRLDVSVTIPSLRRVDILQIPIPVPPLPVQEQIVSELDLLSGIIEKKREQLKELDALAQSIFYDMFGDPITNEKGWEVKKLGEVCEVTSFKRVLIEEVVETGIPFIRGTELTALSKLPNSKDYPFTLFITKEHYERVKAISGVPTIGDLLIPSINSEGLIWELDTDEPRYYKDGRVLWVHTNHKYNYSKALKYILSNKLRMMYNELASGATFIELKLFVLRDIELPFPPLPLQHQFASKIEAIERQKELIKQSISETETLFNARMQEHFG